MAVRKPTPNWLKKYVDPQLADLVVPQTAVTLTGAAVGAVTTDSTGGTTVAAAAVGVGKFTHSVYIRAAAITGNVLIYTYTPGFRFKIHRISASCVDAVTTGAKAATLTTTINAVDTTGGIVILSGTYALGAQQASSAAITAANTGTSAHAITVTASSVTAFAEGGFMLHFEMQNMDTADAATAMLEDLAALRTGVNANVVDIAAIEQLLDDSGVST